MTLQQVYVIFGTVGVILGVLAFLLTNRSASRIRNFNSCWGEIVDFKCSTYSVVLNENESEDIYPVVKYVVHDKEYQMIGNYYNTSMKVGDRVKILYDPNDPVIASMTNALVFVPTILGIASIIFLLVTFVLFYISKIKG